MIVYFSTVVRAAPQERGGEFVKLDWESKTVIARVPIMPTNPLVQDPNPRGSTRGGRGILVDGDEVFVASYHSILVFDRTCSLRRQISHPLFIDLHEISWDGQDIWATATSIDAAIKIDRQGNTLESWWPREDAHTAARYHLTPLEIDKEKDNRTLFVGVGNVARSHVHLNAVTMQDGRPLILLNKLGCVVRLKPTEVLVEDPALRGSHNLLVTPTGFILVNNTIGRALHVYTPQGIFHKRIDLLGFSQVRQLLRRSWPAVVGAWLGNHGRPARLFHPLFFDAIVARPIFVRGLCQTPRGTVLVGISPATILEVEWETGKLRDMYTYADRRHVCVHGLICEN